MSPDTKTASALEDLDALLMEWPFSLSERRRIKPLLARMRQELHEAKRVEGNQDRRLYEETHDRKVWHDAYRSEHAQLSALTSALEPLKAAMQALDETANVPGDDFIASYEAATYEVLAAVRALLTARKEAK